MDDTYKISRSAGIDPADYPFTFGGLDKSNAQAAAGPPLYHQSGESLAQSSGWSSAAPLFLLLLMFLAFVLLYQWVTG
jgi:hypothetical protein